MLSQYPYVESVSLCQVCPGVKSVSLYQVSVSISSQCPYIKSVSLRHVNLPMSSVSNGLVANKSSYILKPSCGLLGNDD